MILAITMMMEMIVTWIVMMVKTLITISFSTNLMMVLQEMIIEVLMANMM